MTQTIQCWTGRETRALRVATRKSVRDFAAYLGVGPRTVSKWEAAGAALQLRPDSQAILDTALSRATDEERARFQATLDDASSPAIGTSRSLVVELPDRTDPRSDGALAVTRISPADGKAMVLIGAGRFLFGHDNEPVDSSAFYIDVTPVTNEEYERFLAATGRPAPQHWTASGYSPEQRDHPVVYVTLADATSYATWAGKQLPSNIEWERAARGTTGSIYPWGDQHSPAKCNVRESGPGATTPVRRYHSGVSADGVYDLSGNTWEWCRTETAPGRFLLKGSAFTSPFSMAQAAATNDAAADMLDDDTGFRCTQSAQTKLQT